jgi:hypothetical protein
VKDIRSPNVCVLVKGESCHVTVSAEVQGGSSTLRNGEGEDHGAY